MNDIIKAPFPWFGGKARVADIVWSRFGNVPNYVEPFAGSLAVLLARPHEPRIETVNGIDCYLANFWRAVRYDPAGVDHWADWPANEADLHARHQWLVNQDAFRERMKTDPDFYDVRIAGWWAWGIGQWIGSGWCDERRAANGDAGKGVHRSSGVGHLTTYFEALASRLRSVRVCCGQWHRVLGESPTVKLGITGVFLDPPYGVEAGRDEVYSNDDVSLAHEVREWAIAHGDNPLLRLAICGYEGEHDMPSSWECVAWKAGGGYGNQSDGRGRVNAGRERIWFSPHCLRQRGLFDAAP